MDNSRKLKIIKLIQGAGVHGIMIPDIKSQMPDVPLQDVKDIVDGLVDSNLVRFSGLRDTYIWNTEKIREAEKEIEKTETKLQSREEQVIAYLQQHKNGAYYEDIAGAIKVTVPHVQVIVSGMRKKNMATTWPDPEHHGRRLVYLTEYAPKKAPELKIPQFVKENEKKKTRQTEKEVPEQVFNLVPIKSKKLCQYIYDAIQEEGYGGTFNEVIECLLWMQVRDLISRGLLTKR